MKLHRNARTTPVSRAQIVTRVLDHGWTYQQAADGSGVSRRTVAKWVRRFREGGQAALEDRSSRPTRVPFITAPELVMQIRHLRATHGLPAWAISRAIGVGAGAPTLVAKVEGFIAEKILATARQRGVPIHQNPALVGALSHLDLGEQIPAELFSAVATVIAFIFRLKKQQESR
jgi:type III secretion system FlhB-like substrate exporter/transposase-like protein